MNTMDMQRAHETRDTRVYTGHSLLRVKHNIQFLVVCISLPAIAEMPLRRCPRSTYIVWKTWVTRSMDLESRLVTIWKPISTDYSRYPVIFGMVPL
jgi:hypothetical protein